MYTHVPKMALGTKVYIAIFGGVITSKTWEHLHITYYFFILLGTLCKYFTINICFFRIQRFERTGKTCRVLFAIKGSGTFKERKKSMVGDYLHQTSTAGWCFRILLIFVSVDIFTVISKYLLCGHSNIIPLKTVWSSRFVFSGSKKREQDF